MSLMLTNGNESVIQKDWKEHVEWDGPKPGQPMNSG